MKLNDLPDWIESEFEFPVTRTSVLEQAGEIEIDAPDYSDSETIATTLNRSGEEVYDSKTALLDAIHGNLSDEYIGRKYYDDRGTNPMDSTEQASNDTANKSF